MARREQLREAISRAGHTYESLARKIGVETSTVARWVGGSTPRPIHRVSLAESLGLSDSQLTRVLSGLPAEPVAPPQDSLARLDFAMDHPMRVDSGTVDALADILTAQRLLDDKLGSVAVLPAATAQVNALIGLIREARGPNRLRLFDVAAQWAIFAGWLNIPLAKYGEAARLLGLGAEWAMLSGNPTTRAISWSFRGYLYSEQGDARTQIDLSQLALETPGAHPAELAYDHLAIARGFARLGERDSSMRWLERTEPHLDAARREGDAPAAIYWMRQGGGFADLHRGRTLALLGEHSDAADRLRAGLDALPEVQRQSAWAVKYWRGLESSSEQV